MKFARPSILIAVLLGPIASVYADVGFDLRQPAPSPIVCIPGELLRPAVFTCQSTPASCESPARVGGGLADPLEGGICRLDGFGSDFVGAVQPIAPAAETAVRELPAAPGSGTLFVAAMLGAGVCQALRKARNVHLGHLPAWYHPDAPDQIGRSVAFDPTPGFGLLPVCVFGAPIAADSVRTPDMPRELPSRRESQHFLLIEAPRGPPVA